ncbi:hypothetical protein CERSUDRAFT_79380 [Gelatoporia subvermispora B]|uniref:Ino eighty subunit 1 n=1 Tax=Ceriporiopsis subvermispora (strain B) TaxID=914234 RepID=M2RTG9_CERS8|nr:hypothetical protein CERSUDRAFT_79380 [Gelatoporia subvermispora B]
MASSSSTDRLSIASNVQGWNPQQVNTPPQYLGRKTLPIKRNDAEPLTREDLQYDLLYYIFADRTPAFVDPLAPGRPTVNFCDLYVNALYNSSKCSKVLKDKMVETPAFAIEFAKIALLTNVGRINTTMAFFPEMKTALRSYHPVPSLQKTDGNLQDAPRIKNCLKAALLPSEFKVPPPSSPAEVLEKVRAGQIPPTSVVNLIFVLANSNHAQTLAHTHFDAPLEFLDLFLPINLSSASRARAFLWLMFYYLQGPDKPNPFADELSRAQPGKVPRLNHLSREQMQQENVDPPEEIDWGRKMSAHRTKFLRDLVDEMEMERRKKKEPPPTAPPVSPPLTTEQLSAIRRQRMQRQGPSATASPAQNSRGSSHTHDYPVMRAAPDPRAQSSRMAPRSHYSENTAQERSMLEQAWHLTQTVDPLQDSDEEGDEHLRLDYGRRLRVLSRLRGKSPTPEPIPEPEPMPPQAMPTPMPGATDPSGGPHQSQFRVQLNQDAGDQGSGRLQQVHFWK